jgi:hypothetical protein
MSTANFAQDEFTLLLRAFNGLIESKPPINKVEKELIKLKAQAEKSAELNSRQKAALTDRCDNYINGTYGNTKSGISFYSPQETKK